VTAAQGRKPGKARADRRREDDLPGDIAVQGISPVIFRVSWFKNGRTGGPGSPQRRSWSGALKERTNGGIEVRYALMIAAALLTAASHVQPASAQSGPLDLVEAGVAAQGGAEALRGLKTLILKGDAKHWEPGQSYSVNGESRFLGDSAVTVSVDFTAPVRVRWDWDRDMKYPAVEKLKYSEISYPDYGAAIDGKGEAAPMSGIRLAANLRERLRASPVLLLRALDSPQSLSSIEDQKLGDQVLPAVAFAQGPTTYIIIFDRNTKLPAAVRTRDEDNIWGDSNYDMVLSDWTDVAGVKMAKTRSFQLNGMEVQRLAFKEFDANAPLAPDTFAIPDAVKEEAKPPAKRVPYQWVIRRLFLGRFIDSDAIYFQPGGHFRMVQLAPDVQMIQEGSHNNLVVNLQDGLAVFDAPVDEGQARLVIHASKARYGGKPIKYLVLTHHHMDHTGGMRAFAAEGATVIVPAPDKAYFERVINAPHTLEPDQLQRNHKTVNIVEVKDTFTIKDDTVEINLYNIPNPHVEGFLLAHVAKDNILWVTDLISPRGLLVRNPATLAVGDALKKYGITDAVIAGGHGATVRQTDIARLLTMN
jgi:glyoxylase-like metal-dependent hydrolase (beta-lactamase superfamily II)